MLIWSGLLAREYEKELEVFIPLTGPVEKNRWLLFLSAIIPLCLTGLAYYLHGPQYHIILSVFLVSSFLVQFSLTDFLWQVIFNKELALFALLGASRLLITGGEISDCLMASVVGVLAFFLLAVITRGGFGGGDVKLIGAMGLWLGSDLLLTTVIMGIILGGLVALLLIITKKRSRKEFFPYGPYFAITGMILFVLCIN
ncbi:A24 family peptidase [Anaerovibrio sp. RM50]|uniref:prepilin peptidase n=1 Tax=Anaerovibrio sp. RM50 TaxID=1200557 RepID=UPI000688520C|nr:A24 family peptidase [Anaerovibrio sp. RM50]